MFNPIDAPFDHHLDADSSPDRPVMHLATGPDCQSDGGNPIRRASQFDSFHTGLQRGMRRVERGNALSLRVGQYVAGV